MKILVDTCIWSQVLRHKKPNVELTKKLKEMIKNGLVVIIGPIRQEILSGVAKKEQFKKLKKKLSSFEDVPLESRHFVKAAEFSNICRSKGIQGSTTDFLICAVAYMNNFRIFTTDVDFKNYKKYLPIELFK